MSTIWAGMFLAVAIGAQGASAQGAVPAGDATTQTPLVSSIQTSPSPSPPPAPAPAPFPQVSVQLPIDALMQDAAEYARMFAVPLDEAMHRLRAQAATVAATDRLRAAYADRWAGIAIDHDPVYRIVILLTGNAPVPDQSIAAGGIVVPVMFHTGAAVTRDRMIRTIEDYQSRIRDVLPHPPGLGMDPRTGEMIVMISGRDAELDREGALRARIAAMTSVPVRIAAIDRPLDDMQTDILVPGNAQDGPPAVTVEPGVAQTIRGGGRVVGTVEGRRYACTTGFVVTETGQSGQPNQPRLSMRSGIVTAAHCPDTLRYVDPATADVPLDFVGQWGWGYQDVQLNMPPPGPPPGPLLAPLFYADTAKTRLRPVATWRYRSSTRAGDFVCHRGERTGYSCALVAMVDFAPAGDLCGGACLPTWVAVEGPTCRSGDSGAPVFDGTTALGLVKGGTYRRDGSCLFYYYMSTDYLPQGWSLAYAAQATETPAPSTIAPSSTIADRPSLSGPPSLP